MTYHLITYHSIDNGDDHYLFETQAQAFQFVKQEIDNAIKDGSWEPREYDRGDDEPNGREAGDCAAALAAYIVQDRNSWAYDDDLIYTYEPIDLIREKI